MSQQDDIRNLIRNHNRRLQKLKEQQALRGLNTPPEIVLEIEDIEAKIEQLQTGLEEIESDPDTQKQRIEQQRQRIADGLAEIRQQAAEGKQPHPDQKQLAVVGRPPLGVVEHFKNRVREQERIGQLLAEPATRLVSVIGHGGMGKTALVSKVLLQISQHRWPHTDDDIPLDGIVYLSTRTAGISLERLFLDCAKMLGNKAEKKLNAIWTNPKLDTEEKILHLLETLKDGRYVILLDNLEDLLDDEGRFIDEDLQPVIPGLEWVTRIWAYITKLLSKILPKMFVKTGIVDLQLFFDQSLTTAHGPRLLVTSRVALAFQRGVMRYDNQVKLLEGLPVEDGVALLRELDPNSDYGLQDAPEEQLAQAVELVHGVPRALEVIAGILVNDPFASLAKVMEQFYEQEDIVQTLIEENYKRLDDNARRVIEALAVFKRPVPRLAVDYLLEPFVPGLDVPGIIQRLKRTNIVSIDRATTMVTLHPIDQDYAYSRLPEEKADDFPYTRQVLERRAADYYVQLRTPEDTWKTIDDLKPQLSEFEHRIRAEDYDDAYKIMEWIDTDYMSLWGHYSRLVGMRKKLLGRLSNLGLQAANLVSLGLTYLVLGQIEQTMELFNEGLAIARQIGDRRLEEISLGNLGLARHILGDVKHAIALYEQAVAIAREIGNYRDQALWFSHLGSAYHSLEQFEQAIQYHEDALYIWNKIDDRGTISDLKVEGEIYARRGSTCRILGQFKQAIKSYKQAEVNFRDIGYRQGEGIRCVNLGLTYLKLGQVKRARELYKEALSIACQIGDRRSEGTCLGNKGTTYHIRGQFEQAICHQEEALIISREVGYRQGESLCLLGLGKAYLATKDLSKAKQYCSDSCDLDIPKTSHLAALALAIALLHQSNPGVENAFLDASGRCRALLDKTIGWYEPCYILATALVGEAVCMPSWLEEDKRLGLLAPALAEYQHALEICDAPGVIQDALRDLELIQAASIEGLEPVFELLQAHASDQKRNN
ncbi:tetratricopeptide repeat protein [Chloroflexota bacterium]